MIEPVVSAGDTLTQAVLREQVHELRSQCRMLFAGLPEPEHWHGLANAAYRVRLSRLRARLHAALVAIEAAGAVL